MSPQVKTPGTLVIQFASRQTLPRSVRFTLSDLSRPLRPGLSDPIENRIALEAHIRECKALHRKVDPLELTPRHGQVARQAGTAREHNSVELAPQLLHRKLAPDVGAGLEDHAFLFHQPQPAVEE